jgi:thiazole synthase
MSSAVTAVSREEKLIVAGHVFSSRLIIGTGKYRSYEEMRSAHEASGAEMVTVAVRRVPLDRSSESFLDYLNPALQILPNTAGCYTAEDAIRTARLAREALQTDLLKLEVIGDQTTLFPDNEQTLEAARVLVKEGFVVLPYFNDDLIMASEFRTLRTCGSCGNSYPMQRSSLMRVSAPRVMQRSRWSLALTVC